MTLHELHPEELLDKAERGSLDAAERKQLDRHLTSCAVCRFEVNARDDFRAHQVNDALFSDDAIDQIVGASLRGADARRAKLQRDLQGNLAQNLQGGSSRPRALQAGRRWAVLLAVAVLLISAQATARWLGIRTPSWLSTPKLTTVTTNGAPADDAVKAVAAPQMKPATPPAIPVIASAPDLDLTPAKSLTSIPTTTTTSIARPVSTTRPDPSASALFETANTDREQGKHVVATREYRELLENYPNAPEADLSRATLGRLLLDDGDAMAALPLFDAYLQKAESNGGALREETMVNRATALERLHRSAEEADAWQALLDAYPQSLHAERARERLKDLGTR
jgi:TolA-binding protein